MTRRQTDIEYIATEDVREAFSQHKKDTFRSDPTPQPYTFIVDGLLAIATILRMNHLEAKAKKDV